MGIEFYVEVGSDKLYVDIGEEDITLALAKPGVWHTTSGASFIFLAHRFPFLRIKIHKIKRMLRKIWWHWVMEVRKVRDNEEIKEEEEKNHD